jgi:hypothetical protein
MQSALINSNDPLTTQQDLNKMVFNNVRSIDYGEQVGEITLRTIVMSMWGLKLFSHFKSIKAFH